MSHTDYKNIKVIGFDLDQTLYPKSPEIDEAIQKYIYQKISEKLNVDTDTAKQRFDDLYKGGRGISGSKSLIALGFERDAAKNIVQEALENAPIAKFLIPDQKTTDLLRIIKSKYESVDLITGSSTDNALIKLKKLDIPPNIFLHIITKDHGSKSDLSVYHVWFDYYPQYTSENFLYIGDRVSSDYEKPRELRIQSMLVNTNTQDENIKCLQLNSLIEIEKYLL